MKLDEILTQESALLDALASMKVKDVRDECKKRELEHKGSPPEMRERITLDIQRISLEKIVQQLKDRSLDVAGDRDKLEERLEIAEEKDAALLADRMAEVANSSSGQKITANTIAIENLGASIENNHPKLTTCETQGIYIADNDMPLIAESMKENNIIHTLVIENNGIVPGWNSTAGTFSKLSATLLTDALMGSNGLGKNETLLHLHLASNDLRDEGTTVFAEYLKTNPALQTLNLTDNKIMDVSASALLKELMNNGNQKKRKVRQVIKRNGNTNLTSLSLGFNKLSDVTAAALAEVLTPTESHKPCLRQIDLHSNYIGPGGAAKLAVGGVQLLSCYHHTVVILSSYYHHTDTILTPYYHHTHTILSTGGTTHQRIARPAFYVEQHGRQEWDRVPRRLP
jgi:hypothetical protein